MRVYLDVGPLTSIWDVKSDVDVERFDDDKNG